MSLGIDVLSPQIISLFLLAFMFLCLWVAILVVVSWTITVYKEVIKCLIQ